MPKQNRVTPYSELIATSARGMLMGNRGCRHNSRQQIVRHHRGKRWILCVLQFKDRQRAIMAPGQYTELFFLDEALHRERITTTEQNFFRNRFAILSSRLIIPSERLPLSGHYSHLVTKRLQG